MSYDLQSFGIAEMLRCGRGVRAAARGHASMEHAADAIVQYFYEQLIDAALGARQCVLARFYKTHPYDELDPALQRFAADVLGGTPSDARIKCLTLLATAGDEATWRDRRLSRGHRAIPLASIEMVEQAPMIAQLIRELGLDAREVIAPAAPVLYPHTGKSFNVFHVPEALGSPFIPAQQEFVVPYGVRSVVGFGGLLRSGNLFAVILFTCVPISADVAERFRHIALDVKYALFKLDDEHVFAAPG